MLSLGQMNKETEERKLWRVVDTGFQDGATNMAIDEAILEAYEKKAVPPTIRFYGWKPQAVSLGYFQKGIQDIDFAKCEEKGIDVVRRLTGGRAVLHAKELTYSIVVGEDYPGMPMTITASYRYLSRGLLLGLEKMGLTAEMTKPVASYGNRTKTPMSAACFDAPSHYELTIDHKKLIGSAQVRKRGVILQHGSILLDFSSEALCDIFKLDSLERTKTEKMLETRVMDLKTALHRAVSFTEVKEKMQEGLEEALNIKLQADVLTKEELQRAEVLRQEKYISDMWTKKR